jgi:hypothetical protein
MRRARSQRESLADTFGAAWAIAAIGVLTFGSGLVVAAAMDESERGVSSIHPRQ